ncbi:MAG: DUF1743 domain-containing protein [Halobacteriales archaeon]
MTVVGVDDTDSRKRGMCTTYLGARLAGQLADAGTVERRLLVRLSPAAPHKTRGNAAVALHTDVAPEEAFVIAADLMDEAAETPDPETHPGLVVAPGEPAAVPDAVAEFANRAVRELVPLEAALNLIERAGYRARGWKTGRGRIGAVAAVGAWAAFHDWTTEHIAYREPERRGEPREVDHESLFAAADAAYPGAWDTVDRVEDEAVCVPQTPGPVLYGIRGDDERSVDRVLADVRSEPVAISARYVTNQGTDAHLQDGRIGALDEARAYRVTGSVATSPETREGGHVFLELEDGPASVRCAAFEPTKRFRDRVRALRPGDRITACGEVTDGTLKLEKFAVRDLVRSERTVPHCAECGRTMESAGRDQGYRCRDCGTTAPGKVEGELERQLEPGWYEVPPVARRHVAKPLVRGGFDAPVHPER